MTDQRYQVVFRGQIAPDMSIDTVKANLAKLFKTDEVKIERLFTGRDVILKKGLGREEANRYRALLAKAGALCSMVPASADMGEPPPTAKPKPSPTPEAAQTTTASSKLVTIVLNRYH